ncbi:efflux RND transporter permease subunit (plasmid) [Skermanella mucosa]|uniref:efflux RND transporter permease subunit n=1 Tax=Skermanella mucosa TaxID=1789672 RepID=UPI00192CCD9A|nr:efflux RND transporter permease subunit [Skermanella mucosa]UEM24705.1 efflux RND transporter permease subunit [Skermanella mucosa]
MNSLIQRMAGNGVAANLLMLLILFAGGLSALNITQKPFPEFTLGRIQVSVEYRGASPEEVERSIVRPIEEQIESVEGVREVTATASEGLGIVTAELQQGVDVNQKLDAVKSRIDRITNFPDRAEEPEVRELTSRRRVIELVIHGDVPERTLKELAYRVEDDLAAEEAISFVQTAGVRDYEISIEVPKDVLRTYGLSLPEIAGIIAANSLDRPAGDIETEGSRILLRVEGENLTRRDFADIILIAGPDGGQIRLGDIARIDDGFRDTGLTTRYDGKPAAIVEVFRTGDEQVLAIAEAVDAYLDELRPTLPAGVDAAIWQSEAEQLRSRLDLLIENALIGAVLVMLALAVFLHLKVAFWVGFGIVVAFVGTFAVMSLLGVSVNQMSLFGFILAVGIVVDDAIVVGESIHSGTEQGHEGVEAAVRSTQRVAVPVLFAVATTVIAFTPLLFLPGTAGKFLADIPIVVIAVLCLSLVESLFILPHHLSGLKAGDQPKSAPMRAIRRGKDGIDRAFKRFVDGPLDRAVRFSAAHYGIVMAGAAAVLIIVSSLFLGGYLRFVFFPEIQGRIVTAQFGMPVGTTEDVTLRIAERLAETGRRAAAGLEGDGGGSEPLVEGVYLTVGRTPADGGPGGASARQPIVPENGAVRFRLSDPGTREITARQFEEAWRDATGPLPTTDYVSFSSSTVDVGNPVSVELSHSDPETLDRIVERVKGELGRLGGVNDIYDTDEEGQRELEFRLEDQARTFGLTLEDLAEQVRAAFFGVEAVRVQRGREEVRVYVRLPERERDSLSTLDDYRIRASGSDGQELSIPLRQAASISYGTGPSSIERRNGRRITTVNADVQQGVTTGQEVTARLRTDILPDIQSEFPRLRYAFGGEQREQGRTLPALFTNFAIALFSIYALLAVSFRSYTQPLIILAVVPFGLVGAALGHLALGLDVTFLSLFGLVGLSGVIINDALILIDFVNARRLKGEEMFDAVVAAAKNRFRPIMLTSLTTALGVAPIIVSQSVQAQFLVPLAASIAFGILFATVLQMLLVPALAMLQFDAARGAAKRFLGHDVQVVRGSPGAAGEQAAAGGEDGKDDGAGKEEEGTRRRGRGRNRR